MIRASLCSAPIVACARGSCGVFSVSHRSRGQPYAVRPLAQNLCILLFLAVLAVLAVSRTCTADVLYVGTKKYHGTFMGYDDGQFVFQPMFDTAARYARTSVRRLALDIPVQVRFTRADRRGTQDAVLLGYEKSQFSIEHAGKKENLFGIRVQKMLVRDTPKAPTHAGHEDGPRPKRRVSISALEKQELSPAQRAVVNRYKTVRGRYDAFLAESTHLVTQMDRSTGKRREDLLNRLRLRKNQEQPLLRDLERAEGALLASCSNLLPAEGRPARRETGSSTQKPGGPPEGDPLPEIDEDPVMILIDVTGLEKMPDLTHTQFTALQHYKTAKAGFERATQHESGDDPDGAAAHKQPVTVLRAAQRRLFEAFPGLTFADGK